MRGGCWCLWRSATIQLPAIEMVCTSLGRHRRLSAFKWFAPVGRSAWRPVIYSPFDTATSTMRIKAARSIRSVIQREFLSLPAKMPLAQARNPIFRSSQTTFPNRR